MKVLDMTVSDRQQRKMAATPAHSRTLLLTRTFVETGDERCPIAGVWMRLAEAASAGDEPESPRPAMRKLLPWRAIHLPITAIWYSAA